MLGRLLEFAVGARPVAESLPEYTALGMASVPVGDIVAGVYAVVSDGQVSIGLHDEEFEGPVPTFVRPDLHAHTRALRRAGIEFDALELGQDRFHHAEFRDPAGHAVRLVEARTFSPPAASPAAVAVCGELLELSLAVPQLEESCAFWERLGLATIAAGETPHGFRRLRGHGLTLGLHETSRFRAALTFAVRHLDARRAYLEAKGYRLRRGTALDERGAALRLPGDIDVYLSEADSDTE